MINILNAHQKSKVEELLLLIKPLDSGCGMLIIHAL